MTKTVLHIDSSIRGNDSDSRSLSSEFISQWRVARPADSIQERDIVTNALPHIDATLLSGLFTNEGDRSDAMVAALSRVDTLVNEFLEADVIVIGAPMYNFGIPSTLKSWIDHIAQAGRTFRYTENGPEGMAKGKTVFILSTRGGIYDNSPMDHQVAYLKTVFTFLGIEDIKVIQAEGLNLSPESRERSLSAANAQIIELVSGLQAVA